MAMLEMVGALGQRVDTDEPNAAVILDDAAQKNGFTFLRLCFSGVVLAIMVFMVVDTSASESEDDPESRQRRYLVPRQSESRMNGWLRTIAITQAVLKKQSIKFEIDAPSPQVDTPLQYVCHVYLFMQGCFQRLRHVMATDHSMQGRG